MKSKIVRLEKLKTLISDLKAKGKTIVATGGCFDILHAGHVQYLEKAKEFGDVLIVFLNNDLSVKRIKGEKRPIVPENERAMVIAGLESVDYVCLFWEDTPVNIIVETKPDIWVKGADYEGKEIPEEKPIADYGGHIEFVSFLEGCSSTNILEKIIKIYSGE